LAGLILSAIGIVYMLIPQAQQKSIEVKIVEKTYPLGFRKEAKGCSAGYCYPQDNTKGKY
jgi:hypothetical protein